MVVYHGMKTGTLIALEGGEGSGKDTAVEHLKKLYEGRDDVVFVREPGGTIMSERIREIALYGKQHEMGIVTELLLMFGARAQLMEEVIRPALLQGKTVIANRFALSSAVYQLHRGKREDLRGLYNALYQYVVGEITPYYVLLDCDPKVGLARVQARKDRISHFDADELVVHEMIRTAYAKEVLSFEHAVVDTTTKTKEEVCEEVARAVARFIPC